MPKQLLILKGSPRRRGNSSTLADQAAEAATQAGASVESFFLHDLDLRACDGCDECRQTGVCVLGDDMQAIYPRLQRADALILASPIYWFTYTAQLKTCIDRWYALWNYQHDFFKGKPAGIILTYGDTDVYTSGAINAIHTFETMFRFLEAPIAGWVYGSVNAEGDVQQRPDLLEQARRLGQKLAG